jgi:hypothetical protein
MGHGEKETAMELMAMGLKNGKKQQWGL